MNRLIVSATAAFFFNASTSFAADAVARQEFSCSPSTLHVGDVLTLHFSTPHGADLAVNDPSGNFHWLDYTAGIGPGSPQLSVVDRNRFKGMKELKIDTLKALTGDGDHVIFQEPGVYELLLSENLETDTPAVYRCKVTLKAGSPPVGGK